MKEQEQKNKFNLNYILMLALVVAAFIIGNLYNRVKSLEKGTATTGGTTVQNQEVKPTVPEKVEIKINDEDPSMGSKDAKVTLVIFSDFLCPYCAAYSGKSTEMVQNMKTRDSSWEAPMPKVIDTYVKTNKVRIIWKDMPFHGDQAILTHEAARCAQEQGKFWEYHDALFSKQGSEDAEAYSKDNLKKLAVQLNLKTGDFNSCLDSLKYEQKMKEALTYGQSIGVDGTPSTYINGKVISGAAPYTQFKDLIDQELNK